MHRAYDTGKWSTVARQTSLVFVAFHRRGSCCSWQLLRLPIYARLSGIRGPPL